MSTSKNRRKPFRAKDRQARWCCRQMAKPASPGRRCRSPGRPGPWAARASGNRGADRDDGFRQPKSNASAIGLSDLLGRGNWRAKRQGNVGFGGGDDSYPLVSNELPPSAEGERRKSPRTPPHQSPAPAQSACRGRHRLPSGRLRSGSSPVASRSMANPPTWARRLAPETGCGSMAN